jgi:type VI secretion system protein ImpC
MSAVHIDTGLGIESEPAPVRSSDDPFRIVLLGDFGGRASRNEPRLHREPLLLDPDNFEAVMDRLETGLELSAGGAGLSLRFRGLDDFHPDHLYATQPLFQPLRQARAELSNPATFRAAAASLSAAPPPPPPAPAQPISGSLLDQIMDEALEPDAPVRPALDRDASWNEAIGGIVRPHLVPKPDARQEELVAQVDAAASALMRAVLGHPEFQALEAAWRSVFFLLQRLETGVELKLYLVDITRDEMIEAALAGRSLVRDGWSAASCLHSFAPTESDCAALAGLAGVARLAGGPLLAGIDPRLMGCESMAATPDPDDWKQPLDQAGLQAWRQLRKHPDARWIGLALPRMLLRLPYGRATSAAESFDFEEMPQPPVHEAYLWGSPAVACVCLLGQAFNTRGWQMHPGLRNRIDGVPVHTYRVDGEPRMTPPAETWLTDRVADRILDQGVMPLASSKSSDTILLVRTQSIADPPGPLAGPWD